MLSHRRDESVLQNLVGPRGDLNPDRLWQDFGVDVFKASNGRNSTTYLSSGFAPGADPPRNSLRPSVKVIFLPTARLERSLA